MGRFARRAFLKTAGMGLAAAPALAARSSAAPRAAEVPVPSFPPLSLDIGDFGAKGDGTTKNTAMIQEALDRCAVLGGGEVVVPTGRFLTGAVFIRSNTRLRFAPDAELVGSADLADYPVSQVRWEGKWIEGHGALVQAIDAENIAVIGPGTISGAPSLGGRPTAENPLRHPALMEFVSCRNVLLDGFSTSYERMWSIHPVYCENVTARNLTIRSTTGNGDGIDIDSCRHVRIDRCDISTGDDCIAIKSGRGSEAHAIGRPTEDVVITNCTFADAIFACIGIGSETSGGIRGVRIAHCKFTHARTNAIYIKSRVGRGAFIEDIEAHDLDVTGTGLGFLRINLESSGLHDQFPVPGVAGIPHAANFRFAHITVRGVPQLVDATEIHPLKPLDGLTLEDISGDGAKGIYMANIKGADIARVNLTGLTGPLLNIANVTGKGLKGAAPITPPAPPALVPEPAEPYRLK
ncbi:MAG: glycoside hydrolase family 28 protein [Alphaproteobacteria bacterium]|nr:glycoside hydrolase family 28 protein [Alphaproteobacteria bacterium]MDE1985904.1 glycoside hydrolase family 28 protein [Alphaproteobacteria bacterium]MDE2163216.1 glycoside hydrolase family 28 protein [Alphaproteobacteria bacterium]